MRLLIYFTLINTFLNYSILHIQSHGAEDKEKVWYKVEVSGTANPIYVDYRSIKKKENFVNYEQLEFLREKQQIAGTDKEYQFIVSKREADCDNKKYLIKEEKYFDSNLDYETDKISEMLVHKVKNPDGVGVDIWKKVIPDTPLEKVWKFVCLYKDKKN